MIDGNNKDNISTFYNINEQEIIYNDNESVQIGCEKHWHLISAPFSLRNILCNSGLTAEHVH